MTSAHRLAIGPRQAGHANDQVFSQVLCRLATQQVRAVQISETMAYTWYHAFHPLATDVMYRALTEGRW